MTKWAIAVTMCVLSTAALAASKEQVDSPPVRRVVQFLTNVHTGNSMKADDWLVARARNAPMFVGFGGLDAMVKQSTARANHYGGLDSVTIRDVKVEGANYLVTAEVKFKRDHRIPPNDAAATQEDMIWNFRVARERGAWKLWF